MDLVHYHPLDSVVPVPQVIKCPSLYTVFPSPIRCLGSWTALLEELMHKWLLFLVIFFAPCTAHAWPARVVALSDGDTLTVEPAEGGSRIKVRLHGIDAPEKNQPGGEPSRAFVFKLALYKTVDVQPTPQGADRYGRVVAVVILPNGESLQEALVREGHAWVWPRYCRDCSEWDALQEEARRTGRGLWSASESDPISPWEWRAARKRR